MNMFMNKYRVTMIGAVVFLLLSGLGVPVVLAHRSGGYSHDSSIDYTNTGWMGALPDALRISELSIPGTHDTMARCGAEIVECQKLTLEEQLDAGIRAVDIRARREWNHFDITHGCNLQGDDCGQLANHYEFDDALCRTVNFLADHPRETVLMRVQDAGCPIDPHRSFLETYLDYVENQREPCQVDGQEILFKNYIWQKTSDNPTLGEVRGKIVIIDRFSEKGEYGIDYGTLKIQDDFNFPDNWYLDDKWGKIENHLVAADNAGTFDAIYMNFLSGAGGSMPYFVASGHSSAGTGDPRLYTLQWFEKEAEARQAYPHYYIQHLTVAPYPPFVAGWYVYFEGTNEILTYQWLRAGKVSDRIGIIMADFPGPDLIDEIIKLNPWNWPPEADAGGPYVGDEGSAITFDASASSDRDGDGLKYRWDFDNDGIWETDWSSNPRAYHRWGDDWGVNTARTAKVEVSDGYHSDTAETAVTIENVAPTVTASGTVIEENGTATVNGTISDPGWEDSFLVEIDWGEGVETYSYPAGTTTYSEQHQYLDDNPSGTPSDEYPIAVAVTDDDGGMGTASTTVTVNNVNPAASIGSITDETGAEVEYGVRPALVGLELGVAGSFSDIGTLDTHIARIDWGDGTTEDLGATTGVVATTHIYTQPGEYTMMLTVADDDTGTDTPAETIRVVDPEEAVQQAIDDLASLAGDPNVAAAIDKLLGEQGGRASNGALDLLEQGNLNAALEKIKQALQYLEAAEAGDPALDLTDVKSFLTLLAKSVTVEAIEQAEAHVSKPQTWRKIDQARDLVGQGDALLLDLDYVGAVDDYRDALQQVQGILS